MPCRCGWTSPTPSPVTAGFAEAEAALGPIDILVNHAAIGTPVALIAAVDPVAWERTIKINLVGALLCLQAAARTMQARGTGTIVNIASNVAKRGLPNRSAYVSSKWGLLGLTQTAALELVDAGIRVNAICPGPVATPHLDEVMQGHARAEGRTVEEVAEDWRTGAPMKRFIELEEIASVALFLASDASSAMTGQALNLPTGGPGQFRDSFAAIWSVLVRSPADRRTPRNRIIPTKNPGSSRKPGPRGGDGGI